MSVQPKKVKDNKCDWHIYCGPRKQIRAIILAAKPPLQIEECEPATLFEGDNFSIENQLLLELPRFRRQFRKLTGDLSQIARKNFHPSSAAMKLCANTIEFIFHVNCSCRPVGIGRQLFIDKPFPHRFCCWFGSRQHTFDRTKDRQLRAMQLFSES